MTTTTRTEIGFGHSDATVCNRFVTAYRIIKGERGVEIDGASPDGRLTGACDRCGTAITNVYVFANRDRTLWMHVGIDCAHKMGVALDELRAAKGHWSAIRREREDAERRASRADAERARIAAQQARLAEAADVVENLERLATSPRATSWEADRINSALATIAHNGLDYLIENDRDSTTGLRDDLVAIIARHDLCDTSIPVRGDKNGALSGEFTAYRTPLAFPGQFGTTYVSFLCDGHGHAFVYKGSRPFRLGAAIRGTFTVDGADTRDGLTSTRLARPRKLLVWGSDPHAMVCGENSVNGWHKAL